MGFGSKMLIGFVRMMMESGGGRDRTDYSRPIPPSDFAPKTENTSLNPLHAALNRDKLFNGNDHYNIGKFRIGSYYNFCIYRRVNENNRKYTLNRTAYFNLIEYYICDERLKVANRVYRNGNYYFTLEGFGKKEIINETLCFFTSGRVPDGTDAFIKSIRED